MHRSSLDHQKTESVSRFFLHGIGGVYNYGCEAIVRGTVRILNHAFPGIPIIYLSKRPGEDRSILKDCPVEVWDNGPYPRWHPRRAVPAFLRRAGVTHSWLCSERFRDFGPGDCVLSIGGDIFTLGSGPYPRTVDVPAIATIRHMMQRGARVVLWGASVGPFEQWPAAVPVFTDFLSSLDLITVREPVTLRYLQTLGIEENVVSVADPAFAMEPITVKEDWPFVGKDAPVLGVNLSPLSARLALRKGLDSVISEQVTFLSRVIKNLGVRMLLVPHVVAPHDPWDDDYAYLERILNGLYAYHSTREVALLPAGLGARRTKGVIGSCDALVAARMHCAIAGVSTDVPTLFVSYSAKAQGMAEFAYSSQNRSIALNELVSSRGLHTIEELLQNDDRAQRKLYHTSHFTQMAMQSANLLCDICRHTD